MLQVKGPETAADAWAIGTGAVCVEEQTSRGRKSHVARHGWRERAGWVGWNNRCVRARENCRVGSRERQLKVRSNALLGLVLCWIDGRPGAKPKLGLFSRLGYLAVLVGRKGENPMGLARFNRALGQINKDQK